MADVARVLSRFTDRPVVDHTGVASPVDMVLNFAPEGTRLASATPTSSVPPTGVSVFTAVQEQLGLRLAASRSAVEVVVIDRVERPTSD